MFESAAGFITYTLLGLSKGGRMADSLAFFMADSAKILFILFAMISAIGFARSYISLSKIKSKTADRSPFLSAVAASMFGAVTPFCSCSSVPIFLSFIKGGVPLGTAFAFLITSPLVNEYLVVLMIGAFGFKVALAYVLLGMGLGIAAGMAIGTLNLDSQIEQDFMKSARMEGDLAFPDFTSRVKYGIDEALGIVRKIWLWVLAGVGIGALIHNYVPDAVIQSV
ncbi:MAG: permease, partial [Elusimicrobiaceae bacterium]